MRVTLSLIAAIAALVPALSFGQAPDILELKDATKDAFEATSKAFDTIEADRAKGKKSAGAKKGSTAAKAPAKKAHSSKASADQGKSTGTTFSRLAERANRSEAERSSSDTLTHEQLEQKVLGFLGSSSGLIYRVMLMIVGAAFVVCIGLRIKEKVKDYTTGRPSLSKCRIIKR